MKSAFDAYQALLSHVQSGALPDLLKEESQYLAMCAYTKIVNGAGFDVCAMEGSFSYEAKNGQRNHMAIFGLMIKEGGRDIFVGLTGTVGEMESAQVRLDASSAAREAANIVISRMEPASIPVDKFLEMHGADCMSKNQENIAVRVIGEGTAHLQSMRLESVPAAHASPKRVRL